MAKYIYIRGVGVPMINPTTGEAQYFDEPIARKLYSSGEWKPTTPEELASARSAQSYAEHPGEAFLTGAASAATMGLSDVAAASGGDGGEMLRRLREANPTASVAGEMAGAIGTAFVPGAPMALIGKGGAAAGRGLARLGAKKIGGEAAEDVALSSLLAQSGQVASKGVEYAGKRLAAAAGKAGAAELGVARKAAGLAARGATEGGAMGVGTGVSELALQEEQVTPGGAADTLARHIATGAAFGGGLALGAGGVAAAWRGATNKLGISKKARDLLDKNATLHKEHEAIQAGKAAEAADIETRMMKPDEVRFAEVKVAEIKEKARALAAQTEQLNTGSFAAGQTDDVYFIVDGTLDAVKQRQAAVEAAKLVVQEAEVGLEEAVKRAGRMSVGLTKKPAAPVVEAAPTAAKAAPAAGAELTKAQAAADGLRAKLGDKAPPVLDERIQTILERTKALGKDKAKLAEAAASKGHHRGTITSLWKHVFRNADETAEVAGKQAAKEPYTILAEMEKRLGIGDYGKPGIKLAIADAKAKGIAAKPAKGSEAFSPEPLVKSPETAAIKDEVERELRVAVEDAQAVRANAYAKLGAEEQKLKQVFDEAGITPEDLPKLQEKLDRYHAATGEGSALSTLERQLAAHKELEQRLTKLAEETADEKWIRRELEDLAKAFQKKEGGFLGRVAHSAAQRSIGWGGGKAISKALGAGAGTGGPVGNTLKRAVGYTVANMAGGKLLGRFESMLAGVKLAAGPAVGKGAAWASKTAGEAADAYIKVGAAASRVAKPGVQHSAIKALAREDYETIKNDLAQPVAAYESITRATLLDQPEEIVNAVMEANLREREFLLSKLPRNPLEQDPGNGSPAIPLAVKWEPSLLEVQRFGRYVRGATHWKNVIEDMVAGVATAEHMEALQVVHPEVHQALRLYVGNAVRRAAAAGRSYGPTEARMIDLVLGPPYQTNRNAQVYQMTYQAQQRQQPSRGAGQAGNDLSKQLQNQLQQAQSGLVR